ncbi:MAG: hypothetical protein E6J41_13495, partial [Chloroflexi bacterium]
LAGFAAGGGEAGGMLVRGVPVDEALPDTPRDGRPAPGKRSLTSESALLLVSSCVGTPIGYREEKNGQLVHDVCPSPGRETRQENTGSVYFEVHTENAFHPFKPDHVALLCLRPDHDHTARTLVGDVEAALPLLPPGDVAVLRQPRFRHRMPTSFAGPDGEDAFSRPQPVVLGPEDRPGLNVDAFNTVAVDAEAEPPLRRFVQALESVLVGARLESGDLLLVDNRRAVHARTGFTPRYDGRDRWLQRTFSVRDFARTAAARPRGSHVCSLAAR